jgi:acylphosphatase
MLHRYCISVQGRVQGVSYRAHAQQAARQLGLAGFVRNEADGSVYLEAEGEVAALQQLLAWCRRGPPAAIVSNVLHTEQPPAGYMGFAIRHL